MKNGKKILLLGGSGFIGQAFEAELKRRDADFMSLSRRNVDYSDFETLLDFIRNKGIGFVINAAGYTGKPNVDACETARADSIQGNSILPVTIAHACLVASIPWGHVSSGCIFTGAKIEKNGKTEVIKDLMRPDLNKLCLQKDPSVRGFNETDEPNFSFRNPPCSFYSGTKALGEEAIRDVGKSYIWRLRIPFDHHDNERNYLSKLQRYAKVYKNVNSLSHLGDFTRVCLDMFEKEVPFGVYNVTNPGYVTTEEVVGMIEKILKPAKRFEFWADDEEFYRVAAKTPRSNCILDVSKLLATGIKIRPVEEALLDSLKNFK